MASPERVKIAPSILSADFANLGAALEEATAAGADLIHVDIMDGHFVPNLTIGPVVVEWLRPHTTLPLDCHLMIEDPDRFIPQFASAGADFITVHQEACAHLHRTISLIREVGAKPGVALNPATPVHALDEILPDLDLVLVMTVDPGFGGQAHLPRGVQKVSQLRELVTIGDFRGEIEVDGGISSATAGPLAEAGATILVSGSAIFNERESVGDALARLRASLPA